jgi:DNA-binding NarL/FixJ family response regulator
MQLPRLVRVLIAQARGPGREGIRRILEAEPDFKVVGESDNLTEAVGMMHTLSADVLVLVPSAELEFTAALPRTATASELLAAVRAAARAHQLTLPSGDDLVVIQEAPTPRELEVLRLVEQGLNNREIARRFQRSTRAIQFHVSNLLSKLGVHSRTELIHVARKRGWLD